MSGTSPAQKTLDITQHWLGQTCLPNKTGQGLSNYQQTNKNNSNSTQPGRSRENILDILERIFLSQTPRVQGGDKLSVI